MPSRSRPYHHDDLRAALISEVLAALEAEDADRLSMRELALRVGVSHTAAYAHFADKDALWRTVAGVGFRRLKDTLSAAVASAALPADRLVAAGSSYLQFARSAPALYRLMFGAGRRTEPIPGDSAESAFEILLHTVQDVPRNGTARSPGRIYADALAAWALVHGLASLEQSGPLGALDAHTACELEQNALTTLVAGLAASN